MIGETVVDETAGVRAGVRTRATRWVRRLKRVIVIGPSGVAQRVARRIYDAAGAAELEFNFALDDLLVDVPRELPLPARRPSRDQPITVGWVMAPPAAGSGGHTTAFRMVEALEARGHRCVVFLYDRAGVDLEQHASTIRGHWRYATDDVRDARGGITGIDAVIATSWQSAHIVAKYAQAPMRRLYFVQDYEPYFFGEGAEHEFAAMTYRLPFRRIALGEMLDGMIRERAGVASDVVPFGADSSAYGAPMNPTRRSGIVFFSRPDSVRRGYRLAVVALREFHRAHPEQPIHVYGEKPVGLDVPVTFHGWLSPAALNELYGRTIAGVAMSFTNITLVAEEMLAAGNIPVVNELALAHRVLANPHVRWAEPTAAAIAAQLSEAVSAVDISERAAAAAASVMGRSWAPTQEAVVRIVEEEVYGA